MIATGGEPLVKFGDTRPQMLRTAVPAFGWPMEERRTSPRRRVLKEGKIVFADALCLMDCTIRDMSDRGAKLIVSNTLAIPLSFQLYEKSSGKLYPATIAWRQCNAIGVKFGGPPTSIHDAGNKRHLRLK